MSEWTLHQKKQPQEMRPYVPGEDLSSVSVNKEDSPEPGGWIARNPKNHEDQWYVAKQFYADNYERVTGRDYVLVPRCTVNDLLSVKPEKCAARVRHALYELASLAAAEQTGRPDTGGLPHVGPSDSQ